MVTTFVVHKVNDFDAWKSVYDAFTPVRKANGVIGASVHRDVNDPNNLIVTHQFKDLKTAQAFLASGELKSAMQNAGVASKPSIWLGEHIENTSN